MPYIQAEKLIYAVHICRDANVNRRHRTLLCGIYNTYFLPQIPNAEDRAERKTYQISMVELIVGEIYT